MNLKEKKCRTLKYSNTFKLQENGVMGRSLMTLMASFYLQIIFEYFQGIANGMFSHIMGYKHRQEFVRKIHENSADAGRMMDLSQRELLEMARYYSLLIGQYS